MHDTLLEEGISHVLTTVGFCPVKVQVYWAANKRFNILKFKFKFPIARTFELYRARYRLYRSQILQVSTRWNSYLFRKLSSRSTQCTPLHRSLISFFSAIFSLKTVEHLFLLFFQTKFCKICQNLLNFANF